MSKLAALLGGMTLTDLAKEILGSQGRGGDTELAHVNKREAALLRDQGGSGTINPDTGVREFQDEYDFSSEAIGGDPYGAVAGGVGGGALDYSYMTPESVSFDTGYGGQPTPAAGGGQTASTPQENLGSPAAQYRPVAGVSGQPVDIGFGPDQFVPPTQPADIKGMSADQFARFTPEAPETSNILDDLERLSKKYPTTSRAALAAALGVPGMVQASRARKDAERTRREMEQMAAPIRQAGEAQLAAGQRGELTAPQQQQIQAARAAARQDLSRRGVTSGTAAQQAENRITELAQRFAQNNIDNGVRLIGAANSYNAAAIQQAYRMNQDANAMTTAYFQNLMRAFGALPTETVTTTRTA